MCTSLDLGSSWMEDEFLSTTAETIDFGDFAAGIDLEALHYFRVPANTGLHHGQYSGVLTFKIFSI